jgi:diguanylate cyclase (GGDEF)-like protein
MSPKSSFMFDRRKPGASKTKAHGTPEVMPDLTLGLEALDPSVQVGLMDPSSKLTLEIECARALNIELPEDLEAASQLIQSTVQTLMGTAKVVILVFDETLGTYTCLGDEEQNASELHGNNLITDGFIEKRLNSKEIIYSYLFRNRTLLGIVAVAEKEDGTSFTRDDQQQLDVVAPYLATKIQNFLALKNVYTLPYVQDVVLSVSNHLISCLDQHDILTGVCHILGLKLGIEGCQFITLDLEQQQAHLNHHTQCASDKSDGTQGSFMPKSLGWDADTLTALMKAIQSHSSYYISYDTFNGIPLGQLFDQPDIHSALLIPIIDPTRGKPFGILSLLKSQSRGFTPQMLAIAKEISTLVALALNRANSLEKTIELVQVDELTGLSNRRGFYHRFEKVLDQVKTSKKPFSVVMIDVDRFKQLNDRYGHINGDRVLQQLASVLLRNVRKSDVVCRFGGEEFTLLLPNTDLDAATDLVDRIRRKMQRERIHGDAGELMQATFSAGVTCAHADQLEKGLEPRKLIDGLIAEADEAMYVAKNAGRNRVESRQ